MTDERLHGPMAETPDSDLHDQEPGDSWPGVAGSGVDDPKFVGTPPTDYAKFGHIGPTTWENSGATVRIPIIGPGHDDPVALVFVTKHGDLLIRVERVDEAECGPVQVIVE